MLYSPALLPIAQLPTAYFTYKETKLHYHKIGEGNKILFFFHGYGQSRNVFEERASELGQEYTCYLFDLFFHGESEWGYGEEVLTKPFWRELIHAFITVNSIDRLSLAGFSLGARFVFATLEAMPERIDEIILMAPDGVKTSLWYNLATYPVTLRRLFKSMILHPGRFSAIAALIHKLGLVDKGLLRFAESQMKTEEMRNRVYYSWVVFRRLKFDMRVIGTLLQQHKVRSTMLLGKFDKVITERNMKHFLYHAPDCHVKLIDAGHNGLIEKMNLLRK